MLLKKYPNYDIYPEEQQLVSLAKESWQNFLDINTNILGMAKQGNVQESWTLFHNEGKETYEIFVRSF